MCRRAGVWGGGGVGVGWGWWREIAGDGEGLQCMHAGMCNIERLGIGSRNEIEGAGMRK
jgi:hypothetical protein